MVLRLFFQIQSVLPKFGTLRIFSTGKENSKFTVLTLFSKLCNSFQIQNESAFVFYGGRRHTSFEKLVINLLYKERETFKLAILRNL
jgi:hypothetical protein